MHFNPADIQTIGIGLAAFLSTLVAIFIFFSARKERLGRAMGIMTAAVAVWSWFGFLYEVVSDLALARELRVVSVMGIAWISMAMIHFSLSYLEERVPLSRRTRNMMLFIVAGGAFLTLALINDLFGGRLVVGDLLLPTDQALAPNAGPLFSIVVAYYASCVAISAAVLARRARAGADAGDRHQAELIFLTLPIALTLGGTRFAPWYGFDFQPLLGAFGVPLFAFVALYSIKRYKLFNAEVAAAQLLIFALWTFTFFRMLLNLESETAIFDVGFFVAVLALGVFLLRSITIEIRSQKQLGQLTLERAKSEFITIAAHQLRTPLTTVRWAFNLLLSKDTEALSGSQRDLLRQGNSAANTMTLIVNDLLNAARFSGGAPSFDMEPGDVRDAVRAGANLFEEAAGNKHVSFTLDLPPVPLKTVYDRGKLAFAIENLIDNAIKYTQSGGSVSVRASGEGNVILVRVTDTGIGIPDADRAHLFEKFFRGESAARVAPDGSGLGLFMTKSIIEGHGGTVSIVSGAGGPSTSLNVARDASLGTGGTSATVTLPVVSAV